MFIQRINFRHFDLNNFSKEYTKSIKIKKSTLQEDAISISKDLIKKLERTFEIDIVIFVNAANVGFVGSKISTIIKREINSKANVCLDLNNSCISIVEAFQITNSLFLSDDSLRSCLIVAVDHLSYFSKPNLISVKKSLEYWADGCGALLITNKKMKNCLNYEIVDLIIKYEGRYSEMEYFSPERIDNIFKLGVSIFQYKRVMKGFYDYFKKTVKILIEEIIIRSKLNLSDINYFIIPNTHGKKEKILRELIPHEKVVNSVRRFGHMGTVDIISNLHHLSSDLQIGQQILCISIGNGYAISGILMKKLSSDTPLKPMGSVQIDI